MIAPGTLLRTKPNRTVVLHQSNNFDNITTDPRSVTISSTDRFAMYVDPRSVTISSTDRFAMYVGSKKKWKRDSKFTYNTKLVYIHSFLGSCGKIVNCSSCYSIDELLDNVGLIIIK